MPLIDYTPAQTVSPYAAMVDEELKALAAAGEGKATEIHVPTADASKFKLVFSKAANAIDKTARYRVQESDGKTDKDGNPTGKTRFVITLSPKHKPRRGAKAATTDEVVTDSE
jgi:hypothetical protein